jgi:hypothetical protein
VGADVHPQRVHHLVKDLAFRDGAVIEVDHLGDPLKRAAVDGLRGHGVEQETQRGLDVFTIHTVVFLVGHPAAIVDHTEEHQGGRPFPCFQPPRLLDLLEV